MAHQGGPSKKSLPPLVLGLTVLLFGSAPTCAQWVQTNGPYGGWIVALVVTSDGVAFAGGSRGLYRSTNNGDFWEQIINGLPRDQGVSKLAISRNGTIFAAAYASVYRSTDRGNSWQLANSGLPTSQIHFLTIDGNDRIFVSEGTIGTTGGIFFSSNGGDSWTQIDNGLPLYLFLESLVVNGSGHVFVAAPSGVYRSTDLGNSWNKINSGFTGTSVGALTINSKGHIIASLYDGLYRSTNNGDSWSRIVTAGKFYPTIFSGDRNGNMLAGVFKGIVRSTDDGDTWTNVGSGMPYSDVYAIASSPTGIMYSGTSGGVFRSMDGGISWSRACAGLANTSIRALAVSPSGSVFAGASIDIFRSDDGATWKLASNGLKSGWVNTIVADRAGGIFAGGSMAGNVFRSTDSGESWQGFYVNPGSSLAQTFCLAINSHGHIFAGIELGGIFRSTDNGDSWVHCYTGTSQNTYVRALAINSAGHIFAGTSQGTISGSSAPGIYRSTDNGDSWMLDSNGMGNRDVWDLAISSSGQIFAGAKGSVYCSTDNGESWRQRNTGLPEWGAGKFAINSRGHVFALSSNGDGGIRIYRSTDNGDSWLAVGENPFGVQLNAIVIDKAGYIIAGTDAGVFRSAQSTMTGGIEFSMLPKEYLLEQNYPNPFNPSTTITYELPKTSCVSLNVYNLLGMEVSTLVNGEEPAGIHTVQFNGSGLASGVYFYRLRAGQFVQTRKLVIVK
jgi:photosystem II stability/assembly factor-like uncharacterized protein